MKKLLAVLFIVTAGIFVGSHASATVGGPTYIERVAFNAKNNSVYYLLHSQSGRGCPPIIKSINIATQKKVEIQSCDEIEKNYNFDSDKYSQFIEEIFESLTYLSRINLVKNDIMIAVEYIGEHHYDEYNVSSDFRASVYQGGKKLETIDYIGCYKDQPHVFSGYSILGTNSIAIIVSRVGDCFEGGYMEQQLHLIQNVRIHDATAVPQSPDSSAPQVHLGDIVVVANTEEKSGSANSEIKQEDGSNVLIRWAVALIVGLGIGYIAGRKSCKGM